MLPLRKLISLRSENTNEAIFELNDALTVSKAVDMAGKPLATSRNTQDFTLHVSFPAGLQKGQSSQISVSYDGKLTGNEDSPVSGIKFAALHPDFGYLLYPARWFPVSGYTTNRFAADLRITAPAEYRVISGGDAKTDTAKNGGSVFSFHFDKPGFPGSIAIVKGEGTRVSSQGVTTQIFFRGEQAADAQPYGEETGKIMTFLTTEYGLAPQASLALVETEAGAVSGYSAPGRGFSFAELDREAGEHTRADEPVFAAVVGRLGFAFQS